MPRAPIGWTLQHLADGLPRPDRGRGARRYSLTSRMPFQGRWLRPWDGRAACNRGFQLCARASITRGCGELAGRPRVSSEQGQLRDPESHDARHHFRMKNRPLDVIHSSVTPPPGPLSDPVPAVVGTAERTAGNHCWHQWCWGPLQISMQLWCAISARALPHQWQSRQPKGNHARHVGGFQTPPHISHIAACRGLPLMG